ncbi:hypothetical protein [Maribacter sp. 2307ULW6-5]|uniref:hypothetical protein n=1 Tax=Maribacter sp. 2307ULW6-5 TaxID=3386275 RepID=UPI0039BCE65E
MKTSVFFPLSVLFLPCLVFSQITVTSLNVSKKHSYGHRTSLNLSIPVEEGQKFFRLNTEKSQFTGITDDTGLDLTASGKGVLKENLYTYLDPETNTVDAALQIDGTPAKGARTVSLTGTLVMEYQDDSKTEEVTLKMPFRDAIQKPVLTNIGYITIMASGSLTTNDGVEYQTFYLTSEVPLTSLEVVGGDESQAYRELGMALEANNFVLTTEPDNITLKLGVAAVTTVEVPLKLEFGIGL